MTAPPALPVRCEPFGVTPGGTAVDRYVLDDGAGVRAAVLTYGATLHTLEAPGRDGTLANVALGFAGLDAYVRDTTSDGPAYLGATVGRFANRIGGAAFTLDGVRHALTANHGANTLHGGPGAFYARVWEAEPLADGAAVRLTLVSPDGDLGFPGTLRVAVTYRLRGTELHLGYEATTDAPTVVNLTNHAYFNLAGEGTGTALDHVVRLGASRYVPVDEALIPTGELAPVAGTPLDFRTEAVPLGARVRASHEQLLRARGYDFTYVIDGADGTALREAAVVVEPRSGRTLRVSTTEPGVQLYSGNFLDGTLVGTSGRAYRQGDGFALETQHLPDSPNRPAFPSTVLRPGATFRSTTVYAFGVTS